MTYRPTDGPTDGLTWEGARDTFACLKTGYYYSKIFMMATLSSLLSKFESFEYHFHFLFDIIIYTCHSYFINDINLILCKLYGGQHCRLEGIWNELNAGCKPAKIVGKAAAGESFRQSASTWKPPLCNFSPTSLSSNSIECVLLPPEVQFYFCICGKGFRVRCYKAAALFSTCSHFSASGTNSKSDHPTPRRTD